MKRELARIQTVEPLGLGVAFGAAYFVANLAFHFPFEQLSLMSSPLLKLNLFVYSFCVWVVGFVVLSAVVHAMTIPLTLLGNHRGFLMSRRLVVYVVLFLAYAGGYAVWIAYCGTSTNLPDEMKMRVIKRALVLTAMGVALLSAGLSWLVSSSRGPNEKFRRACHKLSVRVTLGCFLYLAVVNVGLDAASSRAGVGAIEGPDSPKTVMLVVDAGSWNVLLPFIEQGDLPALRELMDGGAFGYLDTYGRQFTPPSWASIATGKHAAKHGVHQFADLSVDWQAAPLWSIMSSIGKTVGVVNWICTWPPFDVNGGFISNVISHRSGLTYLDPSFEAQAVVAEEIVTPWAREDPNAASSIIDYAREEISRLTQIEDRVMSRMAPDLIAYGYYSTDKVQHFFWRDMRPELFVGADWQGESPRIGYEDAVRDVWIGVDRFLSKLMQQHGSETRYFVLSDHGSRPIRSRTVALEMEQLLERIGLLVRRDGEIDRASSTCYAADVSAKPHVYDLVLDSGNDTGVADPGGAHYRETRSRVVEILKAVRVRGTDQPVFRSVEPLDGTSPSGAPDIRATASEVLTKMPDPGTIIVAGGQSIPLRELMSYHHWSGRHRARGIFVARGPSIKYRYTGAWTIDEPYTSILRLGHGLFDSLDAAYVPLRVLHLVDELTTVDVAPTILYLSGLAVAKDMDGRVAYELIGSEFLDGHPLETRPTYPLGVVVERELGEEDSEQTLRKLKALGYI